ncbi:MAG: nucleoside-diphosphate-sugar epimerase [Salibacteraceae bacterium]|jgi:nucleoside-diphosphate-sugar epimerase
MNVLLTGANGFLGKQFVLTYSDKVKLKCLGRGSDNTFQSDIRHHINEFDEIFDQVIHCAGKAHSLPKNELDADDFFAVNHQGTLNLLNSLKNHIPKQFIFISTVAVYGKETGILISEENSLDGITPYAKSKILAENEILRWGKLNNVKTLILRLPLIAGSNPPGNLGKMISGIKSGRYFSIARGIARRSAVIAEDVTQFVLENPNSHGIYNLTDGYHPSFHEIEEVIKEQLGGKKIKTISTSVSKMIGRVGDFIPKSPVNSNIISKMINDLTFDDSKAKNQIGWSPRRVIDAFKIR